MLNIPNVLTSLRLVLSVVFVWIMSFEGLVSSYLALLVFITASLTDWLDGYFARKLNQKTAFGIFMDPFADKVLILSALLVFLWLNLIAVWMVLVIIAREFIITSLRILGESRGITIAAVPSGKQKTVSQIVAVIGILVLLCAQYTIVRLTGTPWDTYLSRLSSAGLVLAYLMEALPDLLIFVAMVFSVISGLDFINKHRFLFKKL